MVYEDIYKIFPEIHEIKDKVLQQKSADALISAMEIGGWDGESVYLAPVTMNWQGCTCSLVEHIRLVTRMCMDDYKHLKKFYQANGVEFEWDIIVHIPLNTSLCRLDEPANAAKALALTALYRGDIFISNVRLFRPT